MSYRSKGFVVLCCLSFRAFVACGSNSEPPAGSCHTGGPATGSFAPGCSECGQQKCDAELRDKAGSGWAEGYWGGDGACAAFNECTCSCLASTSDPISCVMSPMCIVKMTPACQAAVQKADDCIDQKCATECRS